MRRVPRIPFLVCALAALALRPGPAPAVTIERPQLRAVRATGPIRADGVLDEADWARATLITGFRLIQNREGEAPSESTEVRVLFDDAHVYFGCRCWNRGPGAVRASLAPRDQIIDLDNISIQLDTYRDRRRAYTFAVNPYGVQFDGILIGGDVDAQWDGVWESGATRDSLGWTAELAIPLRTLRFPENGPGVWGLWIRRQQEKDDQVSSWPLYREGIAGDVMLQAADLTGLEGLKGGALFDVQPYAAAAWASRRAPGTEGPTGPWEDQRTRDVGLDARVPLSTSLVLNATVNPDFSQIEADALQIDVNQRYPLFYTEKRPFFLEGADIFGNLLDLVYTRRIADPAYGAKLAGTIGHVRVGGIVLRDDGGGSLEGVGAGPQGGVSSRGWFHVGRASWEIGESSNVGVLAAVHQTDGPSLLTFPAFDGVPQADGGLNAVFAADARVRLSKSWFLSGLLAHSSTRLDSSAFTSRIDSTGWTLSWDRRRDTKRDVAYVGELEYGDGIRYVELYHDYLGPDFRAETGFLKRVDMRRTGFESNFLVRPENAWLRSVEPILEGYVLHDRSGRLQEWWLSPMVDWKFQRQLHVHTMVERAMERWQSRDYLKTIWTLVFDTSTWSLFDFSIQGVVGDGIFYGPSDTTSFLGWSEVYTSALTLRPSPRLTSALTAERHRFSRDHGRGVAFDVWVLGARTTWQFTRRLYARVYPQYDTDSEHLDADALLGYVIHPGSVLYLGYNGDADRIGGRSRATGHTAFFKVSYVFQR